MWLRRVAQAFLFALTGSVCSGQPSPDISRRETAASPQDILLNADEAVRRAGFGRDSEEYLAALAAAIGARTNPEDDAAVDRLRAAAHVGAAGARNDKRCRERLKQLVERGLDRPEIKIIGGFPEPGYPECVAIELNGGEVRCSGVVWTKRCVVAARHCNVNSAELTVAFGLHREEDRIRACDRAPHPGQAFENDLMVLYLEKDAPCEPAKLAPIDAVDRADAVRVVGYGFDANRMKGTRSSVDVALCVPLCEKEDRRVFSCFVHTEFVALEAGKDACTCDSGGPAFVNGMLVGIVSRAVQGGACGDGSNYVRLIESYRTWIDETCAKLEKAHGGECKPRAAGPAPDANPRRDPVHGMPGRPAPIRIAGLKFRPLSPARLEQLGAPGTIRGYELAEGSLDFIPECRGVGSVLVTRINAVALDPDHAPFPELDGLRLESIRGLDVWIRQAGIWRSRRIQPR